MTVRERERDMTKRQDILQTASNHRNRQDKEEEIEQTGENKLVFSDARRVTLLQDVSEVGVLGDRLHLVLHTGGGSKFGVGGSQVAVARLVRQVHDYPQSEMGCQFGKVAPHPGRLKRHERRRGREREATSQNLPISAGWSEMKWRLTWRRHLIGIGASRRRR